MFRFWHEKIKCRFDEHWPFLFNAVIDSLDLREVSMKWEMVHLGEISPRADI